MLTKKAKQNAELAIDGYRPKSKFAETKRGLKKFWQLYLLIIPSLISVLIFHYIPIYGLQIAFKDFRSSLGIWGSEWVGFEHFIRFVTYADFWNIVKNTFTISFYTLATFPIAVIFALMLNEVKSSKFQKTVQMITYAPHFVSVVVVCSMVNLFLSRADGVVNNIFVLFGLERIDFLSSPSMFADIYVWSGVWQGLGWSSIIYISALASVPVELPEAAKIDGASRIKIVTKINVPHILPTVITLLILNTGQIANVGFEKVYLLQNTLNMSAARVISTYVYEIGLMGGQFSYSTAIGLFNNIINIIMILSVNQISKKLTSVSMW